MRFADIDLDALVANLRRVRELTAAGQLIAVVKADAYGHGAVAVSRAAVAAGADTLGVADVIEAIELRAAGIEAPILAWLHGSETDLLAAVELGITLGVSDRATLERIVAAARTLQRVARVHLEADTGLNRAGARAEQWGELVRTARQAEAAGAIAVDGVWSHLANVSAEHNRVQAERFQAALGLARAEGLSPRLTHLASSEGALTEPELRCDAVRPGITLYGLTPTWAEEPASVWGLRPVMSLRSEVVLVSDLSAGGGVSYGHDWIAPTATRVALVPFGYADGLPRSASGRAEVAIGGVRYPVRGRIAMDQIVVEIGDAPVALGDQVTLWGDPASGAPSADEWAAWADTIGYELVTKVGRRVRYRYHGGAVADSTGGGIGAEA